MKKNGMVMITLINIIVGVMVAALFQTHQEPVFSQSRDISQLRIDLQKEMERHKQLLSDISKNDQLLYQYETSLNETDTLQIMRNELSKVKALSGRSPVAGPGVIIRIEEITREKAESAVPSDARFSIAIMGEDIRRLVNELFSNGAEAISVNGNRFTATTTVRTVGNQLQINTRPTQLPMEVKAIGDPSTLHTSLALAGMKEYFNIVNKKLTIQEVDNLMIPAYDGKSRIRYMEFIKIE